MLNDRIKELAILAIIVIGIVLFCYWYKNHKKQKIQKPKITTNTSYQTITITPPTADFTQSTQTIRELYPQKPDYSHSYQKKYILTKNEYHEYKKLKHFASKAGLQVCPKVRLLDLIEPRQGTGYMSALGKIQSKHVDFVICDQNLYVKAIVEIDDNSHNQPDRQERDKFVEDVLTSVGYQIIRTRSVTEETLATLTTQTTQQ